MKKNILILLAFLFALAVGNAQGYTKPINTGLTQGTRLEYNAALTDGTFGFINSTNTWTGVNRFNFNVEVKGEFFLGDTGVDGIITFRKSVNGTTGGSLAYNTAYDGMLLANLSKFKVDAPLEVIGNVISTVVPTLGSHLTNKTYVDGLLGDYVTKVGTPVDNQIGVWTGDGTLEGTTGLTWTGSILNLSAGASIRNAGTTGFSLRSNGVLTFDTANQNTNYIRITGANNPEDAQENGVQVTTIGKSFSEQTPTDGLNYQTKTLTLNSVVDLDVMTGDSFHRSLYINPTYNDTGITHYAIDSERGDVRIKSGNVNILGGKLSGYSSKIINYTGTAFTTSDAAAVVVGSTVANYTIIIPPNSTVAFEIGTTLTFLRTSATYTFGISAGAGVTIKENIGSLTLAEGDKRTLIKVATDTWVFGY